MKSTYDEYMNEKVAFVQKHNKKAECRVYTSPMENNRYHKEYCWDDGHEWDEITELIQEDVDVVAHGLTFKVSVNFWRTEFWSTENSISKFLFEK